MKYIFFLLALGLFFTSCSQAHDSKASMPNNSVDNPQKSQMTVGENAVPTFEGNLIKVNNKLCAVSRTLMDEKTLGTFKGQVAYEGSNPRYKGKVFEFNYCCGMCKNQFPNMFKKDPDNILRFHGLL